MQRYRLDVSYDGTAYAGWQIQPNGVTVQQRLEEALRQVTSEAAKVHGSGRTDQGVHARRQVAHVDLAQVRSPAGLRRALNAVLPADIRVLRVRAVPRSFHARKSVKRKEYRYVVWNAEVLPPFRRRAAHHVRGKLDVALMRRAAALLVGRHDFAAYTANPNRVVESTVRRVDRIDVRKRGSEIVIVVSGEGFLYKMVRSLAGFLVRVGEGSVAPEQALAILNSRRRTARVPTAPPQGLFLWNVEY